MSDKQRKLKDKASKLHAEGKYKEALKLYEQVVVEDPTELQCLLKIGDIYKRLGQREAAVKAYEPVAKHYAEDGLLLKAIAVCKMILAADPHHAGTQAMLNQLHGKKRGPVGASNLPLKPPPPRPMISPAERLERSFGISSDLPSTSTSTDDGEEMVIERTSRPAPSRSGPSPSAPSAPAEAALPAASWPPKPGAPTPNPSTPNAPAWPVAAKAGTPAPSWPASTPTSGPSGASWPPTPAGGAAWPPTPPAATTPSWPSAPAASASGPAPSAWPPKPAAPPPVPIDADEGASLEDSELDISVGAVIEETAHEGLDLEADHESELKALMGELGGQVGATNDGGDEPLGNDEPLESPSPLSALPEDPVPQPMDETWNGKIRLQDLDGPPPEEPKGRFLEESSALILSEVVDTAELMIPPDLGTGKEVPIELTQRSSGGRTPASAGNIDDNESARYEASSADVLGQPQIPLFSDLPKNAFVELLVQMEMKELSPGDYVIKEGDIGDSFFVLATGKVRVSRKAEGGSEVILAYLTDGAFFGEMALLQGGPRTASVIVEEDSQLFEIKKELLDQVVARYPSVAAILKNFYKQRLLSTAMATHPLFRPFSNAERRQLMEMFKSRAFEAGSVLLEEGKKGTGLYLALYGSLEVSKDQGGNKLVLAELGPGDLFGEMSLLTGKPTVATVRALTECYVLRLSKKKFDEVIMTHPQVLELVSVVSDERSAINQTLLSAQDEVAAGTILV